MTDIQKTLSERKEKYGDFRDHAELAIDLKNTMRRGDSWRGMNPYMQEALDMIQHKIARILNGDPTYEDSWVDIVGYAQLALDRVKQDNEDRKTVAAFTHEHGHTFATFVEKREGSPVAYTNYAPPGQNRSQTVVQSAVVGAVHPPGWNTVPISTGQSIVSSTTPDPATW